MSQSKVSIEITVTSQDVAVSDTPASFRIDIAGQNASVAPVGPFTAEFTVDNGTYTGSIHRCVQMGARLGVQSLLRWTQPP